LRSLLTGTQRFLREVANPTAYRSIATQVRYPVGAAIMAQANAIWFSLVAPINLLPIPHALGQHKRQESPPAARASPGLHHQAAHSPSFSSASSTVFSSREKKRSWLGGKSFFSTNHFCDQAGALRLM